MKSNIYFVPTKKENHSFNNADPNFQRQLKQAMVTTLSKSLIILRDYVRNDKELTPESKQEVIGELIKLLV